MTFVIQKHSGVDKTFKISGPIELEVDYDDVEHNEQDILSRKVARVLNDHWDDPAYADLDEELLENQARLNLDCE